MKIKDTLFVIMVCSIVSMLLLFSIGAHIVLNNNNMSQLFYVISSFLFLALPIVRK